MTEEEWLKSTDTDPMEFFLGECASERKLRLYACACTNVVCELLWAGSRSREAIGVAERFADGEATQTDLDFAQASVAGSLELYPGEPVYDASYWACGRVISQAVGYCTFYVANISTRPITDGAEAARVRIDTVRHQTQLLRDIFGNPFRPVAFDPAWRTEAVVGIASGIYEERAFERMPILADALQEAGCEHPDILSHCREPGEHVRGCWVVDLVLGKE